MFCGKCEAWVELFELFSRQKQSNKKLASRSFESKTKNYVDIRNWAACKIFSNRIASPDGSVKKGLRSTFAPRDVTIVVFAWKLTLVSCHRVSKSCTQQRRNTWTWPQQKTKLTKVRSPATEGWPNTEAGLLNSLPDYFLSNVCLQIERTDQCLHCVTVDTIQLTLYRLPTIILWY